MLWGLGAGQGGRAAHMRALAGAYWQSVRAADTHANPFNPLLQSKAGRTHGTVAEKHLVMKAIEGVVSKIKRHTHLAVTVPHPN